MKWQVSGSDILIDCQDITHHPYLILTGLGFLFIRLDDYLLEFFY